ncbi:MAG: enoyl-CoA hydratase-related protein, partial [Actinobacteria bacterium]|nr:enoyl-CoA hydratase-related protein [Actinomycetota bacterium]
RAIMLPMTFATIQYELTEGIARITLNRPEKGNAINMQMAQEFMQATTAVSEDSSVKVVLLAGSGANFCVGGDLGDFHERGDDLARYLKELTGYLHLGVSRLARSHAIVVVAARGAVAGAGMSLLCGADIAIASRKVKIVAAYTAAGLSPDGSLTWYLPRLVGVRKATELLITNRALNAEEALEWGILTTVVDDENLEEEAGRVSSELAKGPSRALASTKQLIMASSGNTLETQMEMESNEIARNAHGADAREGIAAFLGKRKPTFGK